MMTKMRRNRRDFIKAGVALGVAQSIEGTGVRAQQAAPPLQTVRVGFVGIGVKGSAHLGNLLHMQGVDVRAVCDIVELQCAEAQQQALRLGKPEPAAYSGSDHAFERMCAEEDLDLVYTATPWEWHAPVCLAALRNGKHAATEIPAAITLDQCWELVETSEKTGRYLCMMENVNYMREELAILHMVRKGLFGELVHGEGGYMHDTRQLKINDFADGLWLGNHHAERNGNLYPTHGLGPLAWYMNINRGDRFDYLVSMSSNARGLNLFAQERLPEGHPKRRRYLNGDVNSSLIRTANGLTIILKHDTDLPRPYSRGTLLQGTRGIVRRWPELKVHLDGKPGRAQWEAGDRYLEEYDHPLWKQAQKNSEGLPAGAGGPILEGATWHYNPASELRNGDYLEDWRLIQALRTGSSPDFDVYDAAAWSAVAALSEKSVASRSQAVDFPDFTRGKWKTAAPVTILGI